MTSTPPPVARLTRQEVVERMRCAIEENVSPEFQAEAALAALESLAQEHGLKILGREPTEAMWMAGRAPILDREARAPQSILDERTYYEREKDGRRTDGYVSKGTCAVWIWRAEHDATARFPWSEK